MHISKERKAKADMESKSPPLLLDIFFGFLFVYGVRSDGGVCFFVHFFYLKTQQHRHVHTPSFAMSRCAWQLLLLLSAPS